MFRTSKVDHLILKRCIQVNAEIFSIGMEAKVKNPKTIIPIGWEKPLEGWMKLNLDGSALGNLGRAGGGGIIRDHEGDWIRGYARALGNTNSIVAELRALRDGLNLARDLRLNNLIIELDALCVVILMNNDSENLLMKPLLTDCKNLWKAISNKQVIYTYHEANQCTDALAKLGANSLSSFVVFWNHRLWWKVFWLLIKQLCILINLLIPS